MVSDKERLQVRGRCLADIVTKIDDWVEDNNSIEIEEIYGLVDNTMIPFWRQLSREDYSHVQKYVGDYIEILVKRKGVIINGYVNKNSSKFEIKSYDDVRRYYDPYENPID